MTEPIIRAGQIWQRRAGGRHVRITAVKPNTGEVDLAPTDHGRASTCKTSTLLRDYRIVQAPPIGDWP